MKVLKFNRVIIVILLFIVAFGILIELIRTDIFLKISQSNTITTQEIQEAEKELILGEERFLIVGGKDNLEFQKIEANTKAVLSYLKITYDYIRFDSLKNIDDGYTGVIVVIDSIEDISNYEKILEYVFKGGNLAILNRLETTSAFKGIYRQLGILEYGGFQLAQGLDLFNNFMINSDNFDLKLIEEIDNSSIAVQRNNNTQLWMKSENGIDLYWTYDYGSGKVGYFNGTMLSDKMNRGVLSSVINSIRPIKLYPIMNSKIVYIDDFPAPVPDEIDEKIFEEFSRNIRKFYKEIWWPDMVELGARQNLLYTGVVIGSYDDQTKGLSSDDILLDPDILLYYGRELLAQDGEIGIHGFNHQPLLKRTPKGFEGVYNHWENDQSIKDSIDNLISFIEEVLGLENVVTYVPPSNILDEDARERLIESNILIIASLYDAPIGSDSYVQEFEVKDGIIEMPRFTSGYEDDHYIRWVTANGVELHGVVSHFLHPDDAFDPFRSKDLYWSTMFENYTELNKFINDNYRWLEPRTASDAARQLINIEPITFNYEKENNVISIRVNNFVDDFNMVFIHDSDNVTFENCRGKRIDDRHFIVTVTSANAKIILNE